MKPSLEDILGPAQDHPSAGGGDDKPSIGEALGEPPADDDSSSDVTGEAKEDAGQKLLAAFDSKDPKAMFDAVAGVVALQGLGG